MTTANPVDPYNCPECDDNVQRLARQLSSRPTVVKLEFNCQHHGKQVMKLEFLKEVRINQLEGMMDLILIDNQKLRGYLAEKENAIQG